MSPTATMCPSTMASLRERLQAHAHTAVTLPRQPRQFGELVVDPQPVRVEATLVFRKDYAVDAADPPGPSAAGEEAVDVAPRDLVARAALQIDGAALLATLHGTRGAAADATTDPADNRSGHVDDRAHDGAAGGSGHRHGPTHKAHRTAGVWVEDVWQTEREHDVEARVMHLARAGTPRRLDLQLQLASLMPMATGADALVEFVERSVRYDVEQSGLPRLRLGHGGLRLDSSRTHWRSFPYLGSRQRWRHPADWV